MNGKDKIILEKIIKYIDDAIDYTNNMDYNTFVDDSKTISASAFVLGQIGELANVVSDESIVANPQIQWKGMRGMRNRIVHDYENVDLNILWDTIINDLPELKTELTVIVS